MKQYKFFAGAFILASLVGASCKKSAFENINPNDITSSTVDFRAVLPAQQNRTVTFIVSDYKFLQNWMGFWARSGSFQNVVDEETYSFINDFNVQIFNNNYSTATNYDFIVKQARAAGTPAYEGIARILKAQAIQTLVDVYGNIPYSQAFQGNGNRTPKYDNAQDIYVDLLKQLDTAISLMKSPAGSNLDVNLNIGTNDIFYQGNVTKWVKYANTLKLRLLIHVSDVASFDKTAEIAKITAEGSGFIDLASEASVNPGYVATKPNPFFRTYVQTEAGTLAGNGNLERANIFAVGTNADGYYQSKSDPRVDRFYVKPVMANGQPAVNHRGISFGEVSGTVPGNAGNLLSTINGPGLVPNGASSRAWAITAAESFFLQAEARQRGFLTTGSSVKALVDQGIQASFVFLGLTTAQADAYIAANATSPAVNPLVGTVTPSLPADPIYTIVNQKWFALNAIATQEVWTDYRRTDKVYGGAFGGFTRTGPPISVFPSNTSTRLPVRLLYPQNEYSFNSASVNAQGNIDRFTSRIFWDLN